MKIRIRPSILTALIMLGTITIIAMLKDWSELAYVGIGALASTLSRMVEKKE